LELRATSIKSVPAAQPGFKWKITVIGRLVQGAGKDQETAGQKPSIGKPKNDESNVFNNSGFSTLRLCPGVPDFT
jgi:hypothetical protein